MNSNLVEFVAEIDDRENQDNAAGPGIPKCNDGDNSAVSVETVVSHSRMSNENGKEPIHIFLQYL